MVDRLRTSSTSPLQELEEALRIDENALEDVAREHSSIFYRVAREVALVISRRDATKAELERIEGQITLSMREQAREEGEKTTVDEIKARMRDDREYVACTSRLAMRQEEVGAWMALKESYVQRSYMIKAMVDLYLARYYSTTERRESSEERERNADRARDRMRDQRLADPEYNRIMRRREEERDGGTSET